MFKHVWIPVNVIGIIALCCPAFAQDSRHPRFEGEPAVHTNHEENAGSGGTATNIDARATINLTPSLQAIEAAILKLIDKNDEFEIQRRIEVENRDLNAQESMAEWAKWMFFATLATVILTFVALLAVIRTLYHTKRAADYTKDMLAEAKRTTSAMSRAWIKVDVEIEGQEADTSEYQFGTNCQVRIRVENIGNSPAFEVHSALFTTDEISETHDIVSKFAKEALESHLLYGKSNGVSLFPATHYLRPWGATFDPDGGPYRLIVVVVCYKTIYDEEIHQTAVVRGVGWDGMGDPPESMETATFNWAGGFAT